MRFIHQNIKSLIWFLLQKSITNELQVFSSDLIVWVIFSVKVYISSSLLIEFKFFITNDLWYLIIMVVLVHVKVIFAPGLLALARIN